MNERNAAEITNMKRRIARDIVRIAKRVAKEKDLKSYVPDKDHYLNSITFEVKNGRVWVGSTADYARAIEDGRLAGSHVPIEPLQKWLRYKVGMSAKEAKSVAYAVEKKIFEEGIPPKKVFKVAIARHKAGVG